MLWRDKVLGKLVDNVWENILEAEKVLSGVIHKTPVDYSATFSKMTGNKLYFKLENMQKTGSFKVRGAYYKIFKHKDEIKGKGVIAASSGNHAQGVAFASNSLGIKSTIVMPEITPAFKVNATRNYGAEVVLYGKVYDEAYKKSIEISQQTGSVFIHPFNDIEIMGGQGTIGLEIASQLSDIDMVLVPVGGGGLISGIGTAIKKLKPSTKVIAVEPKNAPKYYVSRKNGKIEIIEPLPSLADGVVTKGVGDLTFEVMSEVVDDVVVVDENSIATAIYLMLERSKIMVEGAGALPLAAMLEGYYNNMNKKIALVVSGGNIDLTMLYRIIMRGLSSIGRIVVLKVLTKDQPGELAKILNVLYKYKCNIVEVKHDRFSLRSPVGFASVEVIFEVPDITVVERLKKDLIEMGIEVENSEHSK
ncbi:MAG: threonine ammonia-lyase [Fervidicoccus fontis]|uniref:threonine ammonia-lyase n=1 Tax=Fervidicoccus fontis TaxID=683846 RepID=A0A7C2VE97_9CREN|nr:MAG: threonine ammonia-lyase [Fervidicoccus fontis]HEW63467.1 threonine ammonia-lyase [Fervidicoccus fontis]